MEIEGLLTTDLYTCIASNAAGEDSAEARVAVKSKFTAWIQFKKI